MALDVLQAFLTKRMFDVGADDSRVTPLRETASDVAALIKSAPQRTATFTLVAIDGTIGQGEPIVGEIMKMLEKRWNSYAGAFSDAMLPTVARAIILHALGTAMAQEPIAAAVSLTARSMLPLQGQVGDRDLWNEIIGDADQRLALRAEREWALPSSTGAAEPALSFVLPEPLAQPRFAQSWLAERLEAAAGPTNSKNEALKDPNPHWPNAGQPWSNAFGPHAAGSIAGAVNSVTKALVDAINERDSAAKLLAAISDYVTATSGALNRTSLGLERRTALLWWKEALYSSAALVSYRDLTPAAAAALAAIDASAQTGPFAPRMAEAMVRETLRSIDATAMTARRPLGHHGSEIDAVGGVVRSALGAAYGAINNEPGRTPLGALIGSGEGMSPDKIAERTGLTPDLEISAYELGVWLFRDLQAAAATAAPPVKRKRGGKAV